MAHGQAEYPPAAWVPANSGNYTSANRPTTYQILYVVIHVTQGSYAGAISWFQNPASNVSAHYVTKSSNGAITQMVLHKDVGYHAGNWTYNTQSIGIEHEGFVSDPNWFTPSMYRSSADLSRWISERHGIPRTRSRFIGHVEVPGATHTDPGPFWNWDLYMEMIQQKAEFYSANPPVQLAAGASQDIIVRFWNRGDLAWSNTGAGPVYLATQSPAGRSSAFFTSGNWVSASRPAMPFVPTGPGGQAEFRFRVTAPLTPGVYNESFQLYKDSIGYFGPIVTFTIEVPSYETIYDNTDPRFFFKGSWVVGTTAAGRFGADYRYVSTATNESAYAVWYVNGVPNREYDVYAWWSQGTNRSDQAMYLLDQGPNRRPVAVTVNQQAGGGQWNYLGTMKMGSTGGMVKLSNQAPPLKVVIADAIRIVPRKIQ